MAFNTWGEKYGSNANKAAYQAYLLEEEKKKKAVESLNNLLGSTTRNARKITNGADPMLANVKPPSRTVGENLFLTNVLPIKSDDNIAKKAGKGAVNAIASTLAAPGEAARKSALTLDSLVRGKGLPSLPKNTTFAKDILPQQASSKLSAFEQSNPLVGGLVNMGIDIAFDPTTYIGMGGAKSVFLPKDKMLPPVPPKGLKNMPKVIDDIPDDPGEFTTFDITPVVDDIGKVEHKGYGQWKQAKQVEAQEAGRANNPPYTKLNPYLSNETLGKNTVQVKGPFVPSITPEELAINRAKLQTPSLNRNVDMSTLPDQYPLPPSLDDIIAKALVNRAKNQQLSLPSGAKLALPEPKNPNWEYGTGIIDPDYELKALARVQKEGVNKTLTERLLNAEQEALGRIKARNAAYSNPQALHAKTRDPLEDLRDLTIVAAGKVVRVGITFKQFSQEMIEQYGKNIEPNLAALWHRGTELAKTGKATLKYNGQSLDVTLDNTPTNTVNPTPIVNASQTITGGNQANIAGIRKHIENTKKATKYDGNEPARQARIAELEAQLTEAETGWKPGQPLPQASNEVVMSVDKGKGIKDTVSQGFHKIYTKWFNDQHGYRDFTNETESNIGKMAMNTKNVQGVVDYNLTEKLVDKSGNVVGDSFKTIAERIPENNANTFWNYMAHRHNVDRAARGKRVIGNYGSDMSKQAVAEFEADFPEFKKIGDDVTKWIDDFMQTWGVETGIVDKDVYSQLRQVYKSYFPTQRHLDDVAKLDELDNIIEPDIAKKFANQKTPIDTATGSSENIKNPIENIMQLVDRTIRTAKYNEVGQELLKQIRTNPEKAGRFAQELPNGKGFTITPDIVTVLENGKPTYVKIKDPALLDAMLGLPQSVNDVKYVTTLTQGVKGLITQKNPIFAVRNTARDVFTAYAYGSESNPLRFVKDLGKAYSDIATDSVKYQKYRSVGGGQSNYFKSDKPTVRAEELVNPGKRDAAVKALSKLVGDGLPGRAVTKTADIAMHPLKSIEGFNNIMETAPRLAEFNRVLDRTGDITEALHAAGEVTVNFARGGNNAKAVDKWGGMYVNASIQGLDRFARAFKSPKAALTTLARAGVAVTAPDVALYFVNQDNPHYNAIDNRNKDAYWLIPDLHDKDENGYAKTFHKIPKSRELGVLFGALFDRTMRASKGEEDAFKGFGNSVKTNFLPANPIESSLYTPWLALKTNKDFADRPIVPQSLQDGSSRYLQYDDKTSKIAKAIGEYSNKVIDGGISPKQIDYLIKSYTGVVGQVVLPMNVPGGSPAKAVKQQFKVDPLYSNQATGDFYEKLNELTRIAKDKNKIENIPSKKVTPEEDIKNSMSGISQAIGRGTKEINRLNASSDPDKEAKIRAIKQQIVDLSKRAVEAQDARRMNQIESEAKKIFKEK